MERQFNPNNRIDIIDYGRLHGKKVNEINAVLSRKGMELYDPLKYGKGYSEMPANFLKNMGEMGKGLATFGGAAIKGTARAIDDIYRAEGTKGKLDVLKKDLRKLDTPAVKKGVAGALAFGVPAGLLSGGSLAIPAAFAGAVIGAVGPKNAANAMLSPYNVTVDDIKNKKVNPRDIVQGIQTRPFEATLDTLSLGGAKLGKAAIKAGGAGMTKLGEKTGITAIQQAFPNKEMREFNRGLTETIGSHRAKSSQLYRAYNTLDSMPMANRREVARYLMTNTGNLTKGEKTIANAIRSDLVKNQNKAIELGFVTPESTKADVVAQYVMRTVKNKSNLVHKDILDYYEGNPLSKEAKAMLSKDNLVDEVDKLIREGEQLYDKNKIVLLSQKLVPSVDETGRIKAGDMLGNVKNYWDTSRIIGRTGTSRLGNVLEDTIKFQLDQTGYASEGLGILKDILKNKNIVGKLSKEDKATALERFKQSLADDFTKGEQPDLNKALRASGIGKDKMPKVYYNALNNAFRKPLNTGARRWLNAFKKAVLGQPHWVVLNRAGNWSNNAMEGVTLGDYLDTRKYGKYLPNQLKQQTSFASYVNEGIQDIAGVKQPKILTMGDTMKAGINRFGKAYRKFKSGDKSLEDIGRFLGEEVTALSDFAANPWFKLESGWETRDRFANFIRQAKREAKATGKSVESILKKSNTDQELFNRLNARVNKSLGDYTGKNYFLPSRIYDMASEYVPFYRFLTQTGRTTLHQLANRPWEFNSIVSLPSRLGEGWSNEIINKYNLDPSTYSGGVPYLLDKDGNMRTIGLEPIPIGTVAQQFGSGKLSDILSIFSPAVSTIPGVFNFERFNKTATNPRLTQMKLDPRYSAKDIENFEPALGEIASLGLNTGLGLTFSPYIQASRYFRGPWRMIQGKPMRTGYDTNPFVDNPLTYPKTMPTEYMGNWFGIQSRQPFTRKDNKLTKREMRRRLNRVNYYNKKMQRYNKEKGKS